MIDRGSEETRDQPRRRLDATLDDLDAIIDQTRREHSQLGVFPSMYRSVTAEIQGAVRSNFFDDDIAMEDLAVVFADRYLDAYRRWCDGKATSNSWRVAFAAATDGRRRMIAQHLLAGMNAHINLDLGIVAADIAGNDPGHLHTDFLRVNQILFQKLNGLQAALGSVSTRMAWIDRLGGTLDERLMKLSIKDARDRAWDLALDLIENPGNSDAIIDTRDQETADLSHTILGGALPVRVLSWFVAGSEPSDVTTVLDAFAEKPIDLDAVEATVRSEARIKRGER